MFKISLKNPQKKGTKLTKKIPSVRLLPYYTLYILKIVPPYTLITTYTFITKRRVNWKNSIYKKDIWTKNCVLPQCVLCKVTQYNYTFFNCDFVEKKCRFGSSKKSGRINQYATLFSKGVSSARLQWVELGWNVLRALLPLWDILLPFSKKQVCTMYLIIP